jgi:signal peptidase II
VPELQAARGASLSTSETSGDPEAGAAHRRQGRRSGTSATTLALGVAAVALVLDQVSKHLAVRELTGRPPVEVLGSLLRLQLLRNPGAAFSAGASFTPVISVIALVAAAVIVFVAFRVRHRGWAVALGLLLAGVVGNLIDRMFRAPGPFRGHVVDFFALPNWPVFNVADICIDVAGVLFVILVLRGVRLDGTRHSSGAETDEKGPEADE